MSNMVPILSQRLQVIRGENWTHGDTQARECAEVKAEEREGGEGEREREREREREVETETEKLCYIVF